MNDIPRPLALLALATIVASAGASALTGALLRSGPPELRAGRVTDPDGPALSAELAALRAVLEDLRAHGLPPGEVVVAPLPDARRDAREEGPPPADLVAAIQHLEDVLRAELTSTRSLLGGVVRARAPADRPRDIDWGAWRDLLERYDLDRDEALRDLRMLTTDELIARYGPPTSARGIDSGSMWYYHDDPPRADSFTVTVKILGDYVIEAWMER